MTEKELYNEGVKKRKKEREIRAKRGHSDSRVINRTDEDRDSKKKQGRAACAEQNKRKRMIMEGE